MTEPHLQIALNNFINFVNSSFEAMSTLTDEYEPTIDCWLQFHWEILVERPLARDFFRDIDFFLEPYGGGAESGSSRRITHPDALITHKIDCVLLNGTAGVCQKYEFVEFARVFSPGLAVRNVPLNGVTVDEWAPNDCFKLEDVYFELSEVDPPRSASR